MASESILTQCPFRLEELLSSSYLKLAKSSSSSHSLKIIKWATFERNSEIFLARSYGVYK